MPSAEVRAAHPRDRTNLDPHWEGALVGQEAGRWLMLTAWHEQQLVGSGCLRWEGPFNAEMAERFPGIVELAFLQVEADFRGAGLGTRLIVLAEQQARQRGERVLGLAVGLENLRARSLYERLGFVSTGDVQRDEYIDEHGRQIEEESVYMTKTLPPAQV